MEKRLGRFMHAHGGKVGGGAAGAAAAAAAGAVVGAGYGIAGGGVAMVAPSPCGLPLARVCGLLGKDVGGFVHKKVKR